MARKRRNWHQEDIKAELCKQFGRLNVLSAAWGLCPSAISDTLRRPRNSRRVEKKIAEALKVPAWELWPDRWADNGSPLPRSIHANRNGAVGAVERQKKASA